MLDRHKLYTTQILCGTYTVGTVYRYMVSTVPITISKESKHNMYDLLMYLLDLETSLSSQENYNPNKPPWPSERNLNWLLCYFKKSKETITT